MIYNYLVFERKIDENLGKIGPNFKKNFQNNVKYIR